MFQSYVVRENIVGISSNFSFSPTVKIICYIITFSTTCKENINFKVIIFESIFSSFLANSIF
jgi:hypothetical protein